MTRVCSCCGKKQDPGYDPYYLYDGEMLCEGCVLKRYPVEQVYYYYAKEAAEYYDSISAALEDAAEESYVAAEEESGTTGE